MTALVPIHPEAVPGEPDELRWITPPGALPVRGRVMHAPGGLGRMLSDGTLAAVTVEPAAVRVRLAGGTWSHLGAQIRTELVAALADPLGWAVESPAEELEGHGDVHGRTQTASADETDVDARLAWAAQAVIDGPAGDYVRSHGGSIELVGVADGRVDVRLTGACGHCAGATTTLHTRVEADLRAACPELVEVRRVDEPPARRALWPTILRRR